MRGDAAVGVKAPEGAVAFLQDAAAFFDEGFDVVYEFFFVEFVLGSAVGGFNVLLDECVSWWSRDVVTGENLRP